VPPKIRKCRRRKKKRFTPPENTISRTRIREQGKQGEVKTNTKEPKGKGWRKKGVATGEVLSRKKNNKVSNQQIIEKKKTLLVKGRGVSEGCVGHAKNERERCKEKGGEDNNQNRTQAKKRRTDPKIKKRPKREEMLRGERMITKRVSKNLQQKKRS